MLSDLLRPDYQFAWLVSTNKAVETLSEENTAALSCTVDRLCELDSNRFNSAELHTILDNVLATTRLPYGQYMKLLRSAVGGPVVRWRVWFI